MAGRPKMKMYEYDNNGKFIQIYETQQDVFNKYYKGRKRPLLREGKEYGILPNGHYICDKQIGRDRIQKIQRIEGSKYVARASEKKRPVAVYNLAGEKIATFRSIYMASVLTNIDYTSIQHSARATPKTKKKFTRNLELIFRYDDNIVTL